MHAAGTPLALREWLIVSAGLHERIVDKATSALEEHEVFTVADLRTLRAVAPHLLTTCFQPVTACKIEAALDHSQPWYPQISPSVVTSSAVSTPSSGKPTRRALLSLLSEDESLLSSVERPPRQRAPPRPEDLSVAAVRIQAVWRGTAVRCACRYRSWSEGRWASWLAAAPAEHLDLPGTLITEHLLAAAAVGDARGAELEALCAEFTEHASALSHFTVK